MGNGYYGKYRLLSGVTSRRSCSGVAHGCSNRNRLWPLRRDDGSGVLIGAGGTLHSDWPVRLRASDVSA